MRKFKFRLARVLAWRQLQATLERARLEQLAVRRQALLEQRDVLRQESLDAAGALAQAGSHSSRQALDSCQTFARFVRSEEVRLAQALQSAQREIEVQQARVRQAEQASQLLKKLEGKRHGEWQSGAAKELEELASDVFLAAWPRRH